MRKAGWMLAVGGAAAAAVLLMLQGTSWFHTQQLDFMSEAVELVTASFWACVLLAAAGLLLFCRSFSKKRRKKRRQAQLDAIPQPPAWACACCGTENTGAQELCQSCGMPRGSAPAQEAFRADNWICPWCGKVQPDSTALCDACGYDRFADSENG